MHIFHFKYILDICFCPHTLSFLIFALQIHILASGEVRIFSRNQEDNTTKYPDIISRIPKVREWSTQSAAARPLGERGASLSCDFQMRAFTAMRRTTAHIHLTRSLSSCPFCSFHHSSVRFPRTHLLVCHHLSQFKTFLHLIVPTTGNFLNLFLLRDDALYLVLSLHV